MKNSPRCIGTKSKNGRSEILRRLLKYAEKVCSLRELIEQVRDARIKPRIPTARIVRSILVMMLTRAGSLNSIEQTKKKLFWKSWIDGPLPSADSLGRIMDLTEPDSIREAQHLCYDRFKRNKALNPTAAGLMALAIDGHESHATYNRCCSGCLERPIQSKNGWRTQYYHRHVTAMLLSRPFPFLIDAEPVRPEEDEIAAAYRLLQRILKQYPRAFDILLGDALYTNEKIYQLVRRHGKDVLTVLKRNQPDLLTEAETLLEKATPKVIEKERFWQEIRDLDGFRAMNCDLRVVRTRESRRVRRQLEKQDEDVLSQCFWVTTCSQARARAETLVQLGHARWEIENQGFNEAVNHWNADHVYKHSENAMLAFWLMTMLALNLFRAFYHRNLKPEQRVSFQHVARGIAADLYGDEPPVARAQPPPGDPVGAT